MLTLMTLMNIQGHSDARELKMKAAFSHSSTYLIEFKVSVAIILYREDHTKHTS